MLMRYAKRPQRMPPITRLHLEAEERRRCFASSDLPLTRNDMQNGAAKILNPQLSTKKSTSKVGGREVGKSEDTTPCESPHFGSELVMSIGRCGDCTKVTVDSILNSLGSLFKEIVTFTSLSPLQS